MTAKEVLNEVAIALINEGYSSLRVKNVRHLKYLLREISPDLAEECRKHHFFQQDYAKATIYQLIKQAEKLKH